MEIVLRKEQVVTNALVEFTGLELRLIKDKWEEIKAERRNTESVSQFDNLISRLTVGVIPTNEAEAELFGDFKKIRKVGKIMLDDQRL